jgi:hypothetical protein
MLIALYFEKRCILLGHSLQKQASIEEQIPHLATRFSYKQASMACRAMGRPIPASIVRFMIRADRVI